MIMDRAEARDARSFLKLFEKTLTQAVLESEREEPVRHRVARIVKLARKATDQSHLRLPEAAFLNTWVPPAINLVLREYGVTDPRKALLAESHEGLRTFVGGKAARSRPFPFDKKWEVEANAIYRRWAGPAEKAFMQPCPDFAVREPYRIVIEGKYFRSGSLDVAQKQLVAGIYEALFYLGVPAATAAGRDWGYEYACLVAYDDSEGQTLLQAWQNIETLRTRFWDDANVYVIVIGQTRAEGMNVAAYEVMFRALGFKSFESHKKLRHPDLRITLYFNRDRAGYVSFAVYAKDIDWFKPTLWDFKSARQKKDEDPKLCTAVPKAGKEELAFEDLLKR